MFKGILTGKEIKERNPAQNILDDNTLYEYVEDGADANGTINSDARPVPTQQEILKHQEQLRIKELKQIIEDKNYLGDDVTQEQMELKALIGGTHDLYLAQKTQEAIDRYNLELIEMGVL